MSTEHEDGYATAVVWLPHAKTEEVKRFFRIYGTEDWEMNWWSEQHTAVAGDGPFVRIICPVDEEGDPNPYMVGFMTALQQHRPEEHRALRREKLVQERKVLQDKIADCHCHLNELKASLVGVESRLKALTPPNSA